MLYVCMIVVCVRNVMEGFVIGVAFTIGANQLPYGLGKCKRVVLGACCSLCGLSV